LQKQTGLLNPRFSEIAQLFEEGAEGSSLIKA